jgi:putative membrane protein
MTAGKILILSVDRDDDIGYKAGVNSPVVGRENCLDTATRLGIADPEDSDTNAIFQAIKTYDEFLEKGEDVEIAIIGGNHMNMLDGDRRIAELLEEVIADTGVESCIMISDSVEDEFVLPIIQSYLKISGVVRVVIKQLPNIEGTYYIINKLFNDPKIARSVLVPIALAMILYVMVAIISDEIQAILVVIGIIGVYLLIKGFDLDEYIGYIYSCLVDSLHKGQISFATYIMAGILVVCGVIAGFVSVIVYYPISGNADLSHNITTFLYEAITWLVAAGLLATTGKTIKYVQSKRKSLSRMFVLPFFVVAIGMMMYGTVIYYLSLSPNEPFMFTSAEGIVAIILMTFAGLVVAFTGIHYRLVIQRYVLDWIERKKQQEAEANEKWRTPVYKKIKY